MSRQRRITTVFGLILMLSPFPVFPTPAEDLVQKVQRFVEDLVTRSYPDASRIVISANSPDKRLNLESCADAELALHGSQKIGRRVLVKVSCSNALAIHLSVDIQVLKPVITAGRSLSRGTELTSRDVIPVETDILNSGRHYIFSIEEAVGQNLKRSVREGALLTAGMLARPELVGRGDAVIITANRGSLKVRMPGTALSSGAMGEQVSVRNTKTDRVVRGMVAARGEVTVQF